MLVWITQVHLHVDFFFPLNSTVKHDSQLVELADVELPVWRIDGKIILRFLTQEGLVSLTPVLFIGQLYFIFMYANADGVCCITSHIFLLLL